MKIKLTIDGREANFDTIIGLKRHVEALNRIDYLTSNPQKLHNEIAKQQDLNFEPIKETQP